MYMKPFIDSVLSRDFIRSILKGVLYPEPFIGIILSTDLYSEIYFFSFAQRKIFVSKGFYWESFIQRLYPKPSFRILYQRECYRRSIFMSLLSGDLHSLLLEPKLKCFYIDKILWIQISSQISNRSLQSIIIFSVVFSPEAIIREVYKYFIHAEIL